MDKMLKIMLRRTAWRRAKGELESILEFYDSNDSDGDYERMKNIINGFIVLIEEDSPIS